MAAPDRGSDPALDRVWTRLADPDCAVIRETWPVPRDWPFLEALSEAAPDQAQELRRRYAFLGGLLRVPIVAVSGLINAGKSSLVASFLSPAGRARVLRGVTRASGTHRFTLWCPERWEAEPAFRSALESMLAQVFGETPEVLESTPEGARSQQRERLRLATPLVAFDAGLDAHEVCLLDCPDIQRHEEGDGERRRQRRHVLEAAGHICSAVFVVLPRGDLEVEQVAEVLEALPSAHRVLAINFCSNESPASIADEARAAWGELATSLYIAYDFRHKGYETMTPRWDPNLDRSGESANDEAELPCFFEVSADGKASGQDVDADQSLLTFARRLSPEHLLQARQRDLLREFHEGVMRGGELLAARAAKETAEVSAAAASLLDELARLLERDGQLRIKVNPRLIEDFANSIRRTAPLDLKPFLWLSQKAAGSIRAIRSLVDGVTRGISERIHEEGRRIGVALADARLDADQIADRLRLWGATRGQTRDRAFWLPIAERILERFQQAEETSLPRQEWDERARDLWRAMPLWRARAAVFTAVLVALAAVALLSVAGGPVLLALGVKSAALTVTVKELLVVVGLGSIAQGEAARRLDEWLQARIGSQQSAALQAITFEEVGLPRRFISNLPPLFSEPEKPAANGFAARELKARTRSWVPEHWNIICHDLAALNTRR